MYLCKKMNMDKKEYYIRMHSNLQYVKKNNCNGDYLCPICLNEYSEQDVKNVLTEEDVPQKSLGGNRIALTCRKCNSRCGSDIDIHLLNAITTREHRLFLPCSERKIRIEKDGQLLNANLQIDEDRTIKLLVDTKRNKPDTWIDFHNNILLPNEVVNVEDVPLKRNERRISAALLKNAYLLLFAKTGYTFLLDKYYDSLRKQILEPDVFHVPDRLWTMQNIPIPDGIYLTQDNRYRGFFVIYTLRLKLLYRVCVLIPTLNVPYLMAVKELEKIDSKSQVKVLRLPDLDYFNNMASIEKLNQWCYGWSLKF